MPFVLELSDELGHRLNEQAAQHGLTPEKYMEQLIEAKFGDEKKTDALADHLLKKNE